MNKTPETAEIDFSGPYAALVKVLETPAILFGTAHQQGCGAPAEAPSCQSDFLRSASVARIGEVQRAYPWQQSSLPDGVRQARKRGVPAAS